MPIIIRRKQLSGIYENSILSIINALSKILDSFSFRIKRVLITGFSTIGAKIINFGVTIISVPLAFNYLGEERYGMLMTILSIVTMIYFADLGLGFGLQNNIPKYLKENNTTDLKKAISSTFILLTGFAVLLSIFLFFSIHSVNWGKLFNVASDAAISEAPKSIVFFAICFLITLPFTIIQKIQNGFQEAYINEFWKAGGNIVGLAGIFYCIYFDKGVPAFILAIYGANSLFIILNFFFRFLFKDRKIFPSVKNFDFDIFKGLFDDGIKFFFLQILAILALSSDSLIITNSLGPEAVAKYSIGYKLLSIFMIPSIAFITPLLYAYNDAIIKEDFAWIKKTSKRAIFVSFVFSLFSAIVVYFFGQKILFLWIGDKAVISLTTIVSLSAFIFFYNFLSFFSTIMLSKQFLSKCLKYYTTGAIVAFILKLYWVNSIGIGGVLWATIIGVSIFFIVPSIIFLKKNNYL